MDGLRAEEIEFAGADLSVRDQLTIGLGDLDGCVAADHVLLITCRADEAGREIGFRLGFTDADEASAAFETIAARLDQFRRSLNHSDQSGP